MVNDLNIKEIHEVLNELRNLDLKNIKAEWIKELLGKLYKHIGVQHKVEKGRFVQRTVLLDGEQEDFFPKDIQRISYNPNGSAMGRCNFDGESIFYGCIASEIIEAYNCSGMETLPLGLGGLRQHRFVTGNWLLAEDTEFLFLGGAKNLTYLSNAGKDRHNTFHRILGSYKEYILPLYAIDNFICEQFSKEVHVDEPWQYNISAAYVQLLKESGAKGLIYPSVKSGGAGTNLILFKDQVDNGLITFDSCVYGIYYMRDDETVNEYLMNATEIDGKLVWKDVYIGRIPRVVRDYYLGRTDTNPLAGRVPIIDFGSPKV
ncbi:hypothetical protein [Pedobacter hiemivivus]|uniref:RES domain-containing protein n=1 Tax=Pedobacter hiemivivus TaxID=2530454 RepID=A0A4R0NEK1_9SPHI|nr:hypothetical protein [Pedobacter hiemivivus]TCC98775.1 hypothetical protein EZ444_05735 [Pedobacter hiemivivus]